jgi:hypothetical protein
LAATEGHEANEVGYLDAVLLMNSADDHLETVAALIGSDAIPLPQYAGYSLVRAAMEADAWSCWLLDPRTTENVRGARALTHELHGLREAGKLHSPNDPDIASRISRLMDLAVQLPAGLVYERDAADPKKRGPVVAFGERRPPATLLVGEMLDVDGGSSRYGKSAYQQLCAVLHGTRYGLTADREEYETGTLFAVNIDRLLMYVQVAVLLHDRAQIWAAIFGGRTEEDWRRARGQLPQLMEAGE